MQQVQTQASSLKRQSQLVQPSKFGIAQPRNRTEPPNAPIFSSGYLFVYLTPRSALPQRAQFS